MSSELYRIKTVIAKTGLSRSSVYELISKNQFPKQVRLSKRSIGFVKAEIDQWIQGRIDERDNTPS